MQITHPADLIEQWQIDPNDDDGMLDRGWFCADCRAAHDESWEDNAVSLDQTAFPPRHIECSGCGASADLPIDADDWPAERPDNNPDGDPEVERQAGHSAALADLDRGDPMTRPNDSDQSDAWIEGYGDALKSAGIAVTRSGIEIDLDLIHRPTDSVDKICTLALGDHDENVLARLLRGESVDLDDIGDEYDDAWYPSAHEADAQPDTGLDASEWCWRVHRDAQAAPTRPDARRATLSEAAE